MRILDQVIDEYEVNLEAFHANGESIINVVDITPLTKMIGAEWKIEHADDALAR